MEEYVHTKNKIILLSPHADDEGLFATYICLRLKPLIVVVTDGTQHQEKFGISIETRREESKAAAKILGCEIQFRGTSDRDNIRKLEGLQGTIISPALQGGNIHHDQLSRYGDIQYATYTKTNLTPYLEDGVAIIPTPEEEAIKEKVLACYKSQHEINKVHFEAVKGQPEYIQGVLTAFIRKALRLDSEVFG